MTGEKNNLAIARKLDDHLNGFTAAFVVEIHENVIAEDRQRTAHVFGRDEKGNAQREIELLTRAERKQLRRTSGLHAVERFDLSFGIHAHFLPRALRHLREEARSLLVDFRLAFAFPFSDRDFQAALREQQHGKFVIALLQACIHDRLALLRLIESGGMARVRKLTRDLTELEIRLLDELARFGTFSILALDDRFEIRQLCLGIEPH